MSLIFKTPVEGLNTKYIGIFLNFAENNQHGCDSHCNFCIWNLHNFNKSLIPTDEDIDEFVNTFDKANAIQITGGGDPLFNYEEHQADFHRIVDRLHSRKLIISLVTRNWQTVLKYYDKFTKIDRFSFSTEVLNSDLKLLCNKLASDNKVVDISKIYNFTTDSYMSDEQVLSFIQFYGDNRNIRLIFRENFHSVLNKDLFNQKQLLFKSYCKKYNVRLQKHVFFMTGLYGNEVWHSKIFDNLVMNNSWEK